MRRIVGVVSIFSLMTRPSLPKEKEKSHCPFFLHTQHALSSCYLLFTTVNRRGQQKQNQLHRSPSTKMLKTQLHSFFLMYFLLCQMGICEGVSVMDLNSMKPSELDAMVKRVCVGKIGECQEAAAEEEMMDSESNRRALLMRRSYISYDTLRRDLVPCDRPGASYYNCKGPGVANTYGRGCEMITRCARGD